MHKRFSRTELSFRRDRPEQYQHQRELDTHLFLHGHGYRRDCRRRTYTAPASEAQQIPLAVKATSVADSTKSASVQFMMMPAIQIPMNPAPSQVVGVGTPDGSGNFALTTSDLDVKDVAEPMKMEVTRTGTYTLGSDGRGIVHLDNGQFVLRFLVVSNAKLLLMRPEYDVIGEGTAEQTSFPAN